MIRLFTALAVPPELVEGLASRQTGLNGARWRPVETLHITLCFVGEVAEPLADDIDAELSRIDGPAPTLTLEGAGSFGEGADIRAIWAGVAESPDLTVLAGRCERAARRAGASLQRRAYRAHVTLAYLRRPEPREVAAWIGRNNLLHSPPFSVQGFGLYSSWGSSEGSRYELERFYPLRAAAAGVLNAR
jgi:2'-5' RNA ligase